MDENLLETPKIKFICPKCGEILQDQVIFLCNHCKAADLIEKEGVFICPACLVPGENFECMECGSKEVKMSPKDRSVLRKNA